MTSFRHLLTFICTAALLTGCVDQHPVITDDIARRTALPVFMIPRDIPSEQFVIQAYERVYKKSSPATLYIEGDGDQTPLNPVALRLAAQDGGSNVIWLARPCQYLNVKASKSCDKAYSTSKRFAPEVIDTYNQVLNNIKAYYNIPSFNLVGYDGGAAIATILASQRSDITSIRTVAGNLDPKTTALAREHILADGSLNPLDFAAGISNIPQRHFIGKLDTETPPAVYNSFAQAVENGQCMNVTLVDNADHENGWAEQWKVLKDIPMDCARPVEPAPVLFDPTPLDGDKGHISHKKHKK